MLPPLGNDFVAMIKDSALVSALGVQDITQLGKVYSASTFLFFETYNVVAFLYLVMTLSLSLLVRGLEQRLKRRAGSADECRCGITLTACGRTADIGFGSGGRGSLGRRSRDGRRLLVSWKPFPALRKGCLPIVVLAAYSLAVPDERIFGSEHLEHLLDFVALAVVLLGLTVRAVAIGASREKAAAAGSSIAVFTGCRGIPRYLGSLLVIVGIFLMHGIASRRADRDSRLRAHLLRDGARRGG